MSRFANIPGKEAVKAFQSVAWRAMGQVGSYLVLVKEGLRANLPIHSTARSLSERSVQAATRDDEPRKLFVRLTGALNATAMP